MAFRVRTLLEVVDGILASIVANSEVTDINRGSVVRTIAEAAALQDADQYLQIARLKTAFSIETATGQDLDDRGADFGIARLAPKQATGTVTFGDSSFTAKVENTLASLASVGAASITLTSAAAFPSSGAVVVERAVTGQRELLTYSSKTGNVLTLATPSTISHPSGSSVILSTVGADRTFPAGTKVYNPATDESEQIDFTTLTAVTLLDGDIVTSGVTVLSALTGAAMNVGTSGLNSIASPPFQTATVTNDAPMQGGRDAETDDDYRQRLKQTIQALSNGTINDLLVAASQVELASGQRVIFAGVVEEFSDPDVSVYIDDGTGSVTTTATQTSTELLIFPAEAGQRRATLANWPTFGTLRLAKSDIRGTINTVTPGVGTALCTVTGAGFTPSALVGRTVVDSNRNLFTITANTANDFTVTVTAANPSPGSFAIFATSNLVLGTNFLFNETTGDIELTAGLLSGDVLAARPAGLLPAYTYYTGLIREVQKVLNGDPEDLTNYPGVKAAGVKVKVRAPTVQYINFSVTVLSTFGTVEADLVASVKDAVQRYVNALSIGDDVILAEIVAAVMGVPGITDVIVNSPTSNVIVLDGALPRTTASRITVL